MSVLLPLRLLPPLRLLVPLVLLLRRRQPSPTTTVPSAAHMLLTSVSQAGDDELEEDDEDEEEEKDLLLATRTPPPTVTEEVAILLGEQPSLRCRRLIRAWAHEQLIEEKGDERLGSMFDDHGRENENERDEDMVRMKIREIEQVRVSNCKESKERSAKVNRFLPHAQRTTVAFARAPRGG